jgi:hypothetical protein
MALGRMALGTARHNIAGTTAPFRFQREKRNLRAKLVTQKRQFVKGVAGS